MSENISGVKAIKLNGVSGDLKNEGLKENDFIAEAMFQYVEDNHAAIGKNYFQKLLKKVNKDNILDIMEKYRDVSSKKSLISAIIKEIGSSDEDMTKALTGKGGVFTLLLERAKEAGIDKGTLKTYKKEFEKELKAQLGEDSFLGQARSLVYTNAEKLDTIVNGLIQNIQNKELVTPEEKQEIESKSRKELAGDANKVLSQKYEKAQKDFTAQLKYDGWAGDVADGFSKIWNNKLYGNEHGNTADLVREDLAKYNDNIEKLNRAAQLGTTTYAREFRKIFGVEFDPVNITAYKKAEATYLEALSAKSVEDAVNKELSLLLKDDKLNEEYKTQVASGGIPVTYVSASKEDVFNREYKKLTDMLGEENKALLDKKFISEKAETVDDKYKILHQVAKVFSESLAKNTKEKCKGESFDEIQKTYDASYKAAFGLENDIAKRVNDYNISQQSGAGAVKSVAVIAAMTAVSFATMGMGTPAVMGASVATAAGATAATEVTDRFISGAALDELKENGLVAYLEKGAEITDWGGVAKASATSAGMTILFMGQSYAVTNLCKLAGMSATAGAVTNSATFIGTGLGTEYLMTGEISAQGATFTVLLAVVGGALQVIQIQKAEALNAAQQEAKLGSDIQSAREALGFDNDTPITADQLKAQYRKMAAQNHPDAGGSDIAMATINSAHDVLQNNMARINDFLGKVIQPPTVTSAPATQAASQAAAVKPATKTTSLSTCILPKSMQVQAGTIGTIPVRVAVGDLTSVKADAYLVPQFDSCSSEGGVGGAIWSRGAEKGMEAYNAHIEANGKQEYGSVVVTESGGGNAAKLLHAVTVGSGRESAFKTVQDAVYNALKAAEKEGIHSVAIPEVGTGIIGELTGQQSAQAIMSGINRFSAEGGKMDVSLVIYGSQKDFNTFVSTMNNKTYADATPTVGAREFDAGRWVTEMTNPGSTTAEVATPASASSASTDFAQKLATFKQDGRAILSPEDIKNLLDNRTGLGGAEIKNFEDKVLAVLSNPEELANLAFYENKSFGVWRAIQDPIDSTVAANPKAFGTTSTEVAQPIVETSTNKEGAFVTTNPDGTRTESLYNNRGKFLSQKTEFDASGHKTKTLTISESGVKTTTTYDINENVTSQEEYFPKTQASDEVTRHTHYKNGEITEIVVRDKFYNPVSIAVKNPDGSVTKTTFQKDGSSVETTISADKVASNPEILKPATPTEITKALIVTGQNGTQVNAAAVQSAKTFTPVQLDALKKVGFTQSVIEALKKDGDIAELYNPKLLDDTLDMVLYLEDMTKQGQKITRDSLHAAILECAPGSSGGSSSVMLRLIANNWNRGVEIYNALGEQAPANVVQRAETAKLQQKLIKNLSGDKYAKHWSLEDLAKGVETIENHPEMVETLANAKASNGKPLFSLDEIDDAILNCRKTIEKSPEVITAILSNPDEIKIISEWNNKAAGLWKATSDPLDSTVAANPKAFETTSTEVATPAASSASSDFAQKLATFKQDGRAILSPEDIKDLLGNRKGLGGGEIKNFEARIEAVLSNPEELANLAFYENKSFGVWRAIQDPLDSTVANNPKAFGIETKPKLTKSDLIAALDKVHYDKAYAKQLIEAHPEMVETLIAATDANGNPLFSALDIDDILYNCQQNISRNPQSIINVLKDPKLVADITSGRNRAATLWMIVRDEI